MGEMMTNVDAREYLAALVPGIEVVAGSPNNFTVSHPKRVLTLNSFANAANKLGLIHSGTRSATNRNQFIVLYVTPRAGLEFCFKSNNAKEITVDVRA